MKRIMRISATFITLLVLSSQTWAISIFSSDRFGYTGTITRYGTLTDAQNNTNALDSVNIEDAAGNDSREHRDASIYVVDGSAGNDAVIVMGSWWYTTSTNGAGWGNINGNTGIGFMQLYDADASTTTSVDLGFEVFDGTYWTEYYMRVEGSNATPTDDYARLSAYDNVHDAGTYLDYVLDIRATGVEGSKIGDSIIATNHPTGVVGTFTALFSFGGDSDGYPDNVGPAAGWGDDFYRVALNFDMENWAFSQNGNLQGPYHDNNNIYSSYFESSVPEPTTLAILSLGLAGIGYSRKQKPVR